MRKVLLEQCGRFSPNIEAKCLARNQKKVLDAYQSRADALVRNKELISQEDFEHILKFYSDQMAMIRSTYQDEGRVQNSHHVNHAQAKMQQDIANALKVIDEGVNMFETAMERAERNKVSYEDFIIHKEEKRVYDKQEEADDEYQHHHHHHHHRHHHHHHHDDYIQHYEFMV